jgi:hypothetical protein
MVAQLWQYVHVYVCIVCALNVHEDMALRAAATQLCQSFTRASVGKKEIVAQAFVYMLQRTASFSGSAYARLTVSSHQGLQLKYALATVNTLMFYHIKALPLAFNSARVCCHATCAAACVDSKHATQ